MLANVAGNRIYFGSHDVAISYRPCLEPEGVGRDVPVCALDVVSLRALFHRRTWTPSSGTLLCQRLQRWYSNVPALSWRLLWRDHYYSHGSVMPRQTAVSACILNEQLLLFPSRGVASNKALWNISGTSHCVRTPFSRREPINLAGLEHQLNMEAGLWLFGPLFTDCQRWQAFCQERVPQHGQTVAGDGLQC